MSRGWRVFITRETSALGSAFKWYVLMFKKNRCISHYFDRWCNYLGAFCITLSSAIDQESLSESIKVENSHSQDDSIPVDWHLRVLLATAGEEHCLMNVSLFDVLIKQQEWEHPLSSVLREPHVTLHYPQISQYCVPLTSGILYVRFAPAVIYQSKCTVVRRDHKQVFCGSDRSLRQTNIIAISNFFHKNNTFLQPMGL